MLYDGNQIKIDAFNKLIAKGVFIPINKTELYHGRAGNVGDKWKVDPHYNNGGNKTGNYNTNGISALNLGDKKVATAFAQARSRENGMTVPEIYRILSYDKDAVTFNISDKTLFEDKEVMECIRTLCYPGLTAGAQISFADKDKYKTIFKQIMDSKYVKSRTFSNDEIEEVISNLNLVSPSEQQIARHLLVSRTTNQVMKYLPREMLKAYIYGETSIGKYPISREYLASFFVENHIVGISNLIDSATINETIVAHQIFDLKKINVEKVVGDVCRQCSEEYAPLIETLMLNQTKFFNNENAFLVLCKNPSVIMKYACENNQVMLNDFNQKVGLWEGFTLGEHTHSVLKFFEDNFVKTASVSPDLVPIMNFMILCHDAGKYQAYTQGFTRGSHEEANVYKSCICELAKTFGVDEKFVDFTYQFCKESQKFTTDYYVKNNQEALKNLDECSKQNLESVEIEPQPKTIAGLSSMSRILQTCDSGAYTIYGITTQGGQFHNLNERFTQGFAETPFGYRFKQDAEMIEENNSPTFSSMNQENPAIQ